MSEFGVKYKKDESVQLAFCSFSITCIHKVCPNLDCSEPLVDETWVLVGFCAFTGTVQLLFILITSFFYVSVRVG